ncbi:hypothetical protein WN51_03350 [Melipona quadrifasciata]|uniref:Uncharacterized protein n=1 Tax=Melipona quadrifasciata TaxID=166423 RepID=A0A0N0U474_9HYME|nr:hypothetical protein WN51_03350 [Melipona quadrifasciata]
MSSQSVQRLALTFERSIEPIKCDPGDSRMRACSKWPIDPAVFCKNGNNGHRSIAVTCEIPRHRRKILTLGYNDYQCHFLETYEIVDWFFPVRSKKLLIHEWNCKITHADVTLRTKNNVLKQTNVGSSTPTILSLKERPTMTSFLLPRRVSRSYTMLALIATNLVISMPAPPSKPPRPPEDGFSSVPKILEIQLPLKIATKDDLVAWARYVMGLMASKINITLTTVKEAPSKNTPVGNARAPGSNAIHRHPDNARPSSLSGMRSPAFHSFNSGKPVNGVRQFANSKSFEGAREPVFVKSPVDSPNLLKTSEQQLFVPPFPEFGPAVSIDVEPTTVFRNTNVVSPPTRAYLPVPTISDNIKFPNDPFVTRYFFDGIERNVSNNFAADEITFTTQNPLSTVFGDELPAPFKGVDFLSQQGNVSSVKPLLKVPFQAVITFTREEPAQTTTLRSEASKYFTIPTRDPLDQFPPYFDTSNFTVTNESGQINVVFDDGVEVTENTGAKKEGRKKQEKKKDKSKKQKSETERRPSAISQLLRTFIAIRRNNTPSTNLSPPPLNQQTSTNFSPPPLNLQTSTTTTQRAPARQRVPPPQKTQLYPTERPSENLEPSAVQASWSLRSLRNSRVSDRTSPSEALSVSASCGPEADQLSVSGQKGRRNQTSLAQQVEEDSKEDSAGKSEENGNEDNGDVESNEESNADESSNESESSEEDDDDDDEGGGSIKAIIELLTLVAPALEDLSDPDSDADIVDLLELGVPLLQDLSEGDDENEASDIPALVLPVLLQLSEAPGEGGSSIADLSNASLGPLLEPIGPGKMSRLSNLIATVVSSLSKNSGPGGKSDLTSLVKAVVAGSIAGTSAGSSGSSSSGGHKDTYGAPTSYGNSYRGPPRPNGYPKPPVRSNSDQLGSSINEILNAIFKVVASLVNAISTVLNASSKTFAETGSPSVAYGAPPKYSAPSRYRAPPEHGAPPRNMVPLSETISITTSEPQPIADPATTEDAKEFVLDRLQFHPEMNITLARQIDHDDIHQTKEPDERLKCVAKIAFHLRSIVLRVYLSDLSTIGDNIWRGTVE